MRHTPFIAVALLVAGCVTTRAGDVPPWEPIPHPTAEEIETVLYLVGDAGLAREENSALIRRLRNEIEEWSCALQRDSAVLVLFLGDNVYPEGLRPRGTPGFPTDSTHLYAQVATVDGPCAVRHEATAYFLAGNHDWGTEPGEAGQRRLQNMEAELERASATGINVRMTPRAGTPGPSVIDVGRYLRLVLIDTAWFLLNPNDTERALLLDRVHNAMRTAGRREVVIAAHHAFQSAGPHGGFIPFFKWMGIKWLLSRSGAWLQDLSSGPYKEFRQGLYEVFERSEPPLIFAGGHEHSLQVISARDPNDPRHMLVSGSASKLSDVGHTDGMRYRSDLPGFMRVVILRSGAVDLFVMATRDERPLCEQTDDAARETCLREGAAAFEVVYSDRLIGPV